MDLQLKGKNAVVLGGTRGIGRAIAETLAGEGVHIALCSRNADAAAEAAGALAAKGVKALGRPADMANGQQIRNFIHEAGAALGGIDILISNASALDMGNSDEAWLHGLKTDVLGAVNAVDAALPFLTGAAEKHGDAAIVLIASVSAAEASSAQSYGAMKAALIHYGKGLARQHAGKKIRTNVISPGTIYFKGGVWEMIEKGAPEMFKNSLARNPLGRMGTPQEIANVAVFLASPAASFTTGANVIVDGGITARVNY
ncbi:MAG: SDR family oxidoreductase [Alphaproteobacteria bacterium]|nr:SDR family oxidoreductase [Alphaproteobacteria bacterium]